MFIWTTSEASTMTEPSGFIHVEREGAVGTIVLARPDRRNALKSVMYGEIADAIRSFQADDGVNAIVIRGQGRDFCAGNDISDFDAFGKVVEKTGLDPQSIVTRKTPSIDLVYVLMELDRPIIACVQGNAVGFGATMLLHCDVVVAEPDAKLRYPFVDLAMVPEAGSTFLMRERLGYLKAAEILFNARPVSAEEGLALGLISEIVKPGAGAARGAEIAAAFAEKPPKALRATKRLMMRDYEPLGDRVSEEFRVIAERTSSPEARAVFARMLKK
jgi:enoyl-CoA hydratase/carnithine racemase